MTMDIKEKLSEKSNESRSILSNSPLSPIELDSSSLNSD